MIMVGADGKEIITCPVCNAPLEIAPMEGFPRSRFAYEITHKKDGTPIKNLETEGAFLGTVELGWCPTCQEHITVLDDLCEQPQEWAKLPKWNGEKPQ
jgi:hypothetical protein